MGTESQTFVQMGTSINGENSMERNNKCQGGRKEFWRHKRKKMKRVCCCFGFLLLLNLFVTFCTLFHTGAILHEVHELKDMDSKSFCSSFCMDFCEDNNCDDLYTCRDLCQTNVESTLGSMESSSSRSRSSSSSDSDDESTSDVEVDEDVEEVDDQDLVDDEPPKLGGDEDYQQHGTTEQKPEEASGVVSDTLPGDENNEESSTTGDGHDGRRAHEGDRHHGRSHRGEGGNHRFKRYRHH